MNIELLVMLRYKGVDYPIVYVIMICIWINGTCWIASKNLMLNMSD